MSHARARWTVLAVLAALLAVGALTLDRDGFRHLFGGFTRAVPAAEPRTPLTADPPESEGPRLEGARRSAPTVQAPAETARGPVTVRVTDRCGRAVPGVRVALDVAGPKVATHEGLTDTTGRVFFAGEVPYDGTAAASVTPRGRQDGFILVSLGDSHLDPDDWPLVPGERLGMTSVLGALVAITIDTGLPLDVDVRDASDGDRTNARWQATPRFEWPEETRDQATVPRTGGPLEISVDAPAGWVADPSEKWDLHVHPQARRLLAVVPVRPEIGILAQFPPGVLPFREDDWQPRITVADHAPATIGLSALRDGRVRIGGVPHLLGERVVLGGTLQGRFTTSGEAALDANPHADLLIPLALEELVPVEESRLVFFELDFAGVGVMRFTDTGIVCRISQAQFYVAPPSANSGTLSVRVWLPTGAVAAGAKVHAAGVTAAADVEGRALLGGLPPGPAEVVVSLAGAVTTARTEVKTGETGNLDVRTTDGGALEVHVVDHLARPLPYAKLVVTQPSKIPWVDLDGDVQRVDPYTDVQGRRTLRMLEPGVVGVTASYGSRSAKAEVTVLDGQTTRVRLVLRFPEPKEAAAEGAPPPAPPGVVEPVAAER